MSTAALWVEGIRACLLDLDGTLVDTLGDFELALTGMLRELGREPLTRAQIEPVVGKGTEHLVRTVLQRTGASAAPPDDTELARALASYHAHYARINGQASTVYASVPEGLAGLQALNLPLVCVTNKPQAAADALLRHLGLRDAVVQVYGGDSFARRKPDPLPLLKASEALGLPPAQVLMVGDSSNDARAARAAGCPVVLMSYGYNHGDDVREAGADAVFDRLDAVAQALAAAGQPGARAAGETC
ncbi:phosphoglycolate phosphatase [Comamonas serinivorans]|uniref:Phosphoglycolate phosphatase n=1 Tax=Comamonas serinivorans TaxID=1082851 RepID=A0A1Y0EKC1_9BURK|nr:phosphoglycolate phosphatase [Comamonas serinivorans]ARU03732.1 phosphoglycolate phosphatase [Comamonas serinivorans]